ncbi:MAG: aspartate aminotransferase family protein [Hyphomicrobiaceae bacterium]
MSALLPTYARADLEFAEGQGARMTTTDGRSFLDFSSGIAVNALGHRHPKLVAAITEQANKVWHTSNLYRIPGQERLAERLVAATFADRVFFTNSGMEAIECGLKTARRYHHVTGNPQRWRVITFEGAFHGRSLATISAGNQAKHLDGFGPKVDGFDHVGFGDLDALTMAITDETAAILIEPVQGEGGIRPASAQFMKDLRALCDEHGLLLMLDEVQCGMGRTGKLYAYEWAGIEPDIMATAKALGGGFPVGACLMTERAGQGMVAGTHGTTYGGNPLAMAVANAVLDVMLEPGFLEAVADKALRLKQQLASLQDAHPEIIEEVRGMGLMMGVKCREGVACGDVVAAARDAGLLTVPAGDNTVRLLPPLIISDEELSEAVGALDTACTALKAAQAAE